MSRLSEQVCSLPSTPPCLHSQAATVPAPFDFPAGLGYNVARTTSILERGGRKLANTQSAEKRIRSSQRRREINQVHRSQTRTYVKRTRQLIAAGHLEEAEVAARQAIKALDKAAQKGVIHSNNAARGKSRLLKQLSRAKSASA